MSAADIPRPAAGRLLVATPDLVDPNFSHTVLLLLAVRSEGALGVVLNRPSDTPVSEVLEPWGDRVVSPAVMFFGGPVGLDAVVGLTAAGTFDLNDPLVDDTVPPLRLFAGSAGWGPGQLDTEISQGSWWVFDAAPDDVTTADPGTLWSRVLRRQRGRVAWFSLATADPSFN